MFGLSRHPHRSQFEALLVPCLDPLYASAIRMTRHEGNAEDLVQDTAMRAWRFFDKFQEGTNFRAWIFKILTNTFINRYRRSTRERSIQSDAERETIEAHFLSQDLTEQTKSPEALLLDRALTADVLKAIDELSIDFRMVVVLADLQEFSYREISDILEIPVGTVMSRLFRGRKQLQKILMAHENASMPGTLNLDIFRQRKKLA
jgi:RNA polymerase sigma-70 factor (ECF subfamily)